VAAPWLLTVSTHRRWRRMHCLRSRGEIAFVMVGSRRVVRSHWQNSVVSSPTVRKKREFTRSARPYLHPFLALAPRCSATPQNHLENPRHHSTMNSTHQSRTTKLVPKYNFSHSNLLLSFTHHHMTIVPYTQATPSKHYSYTIPPPTTLSYTVSADPHILLPYIMHVAAQYPLDTRAS